MKAISPDSRHVYVTAKKSGAITVFALHLDDEDDEDDGQQGGGGGGSGGREEL